ncbi:hypothetical protein FXO38_22277 [Capsicum annuum]|uniref:Ubiquitin-like protease family profile domain-containing protein n=1 Tax=Capsicum annuum TaxID=4072 RepID=A0A2G2YHL2_CAPAN|nr:hypothetical protein FXO38_22277 [Capsicum annuum]PHT69236.1 hypothetical protein T459_28723 [Capsicum annuum]
MEKYFPGSKSSVKRSLFIERFKLGNFENNSDALNMSIIYFIHTFLYSQVRDSIVRKLNFVMVENGSYEQFSWGNSSFEKLITSWRQDFFVAKQLYSMGGMPHVLNVWMYECCSEVDSTIAERMENVIPRIFNWQVVGIKVKYEKFMVDMFSKFVYNNIQPTHEEVQSLDLKMIEGFQLKEAECGFSPEIDVDCSDKRSVVDIQSQVDLDIQGFEEFSTVPPIEILKKAGLITDDSTSHPTKKHKTVRFDSTTVEEQHIDVIFYHLRKKSKLRNDQDYRFTTTNYFFKNYIDKTYSRYYEDDTDTVLITQQDYVESVCVALIEETITYIIKGYYMSSDLPSHQVDKVYVPINCNENFHWVLAVIALKDRYIRVYNSLFKCRNTESITKIQKLAKMLPTYLSDSKFYDETSRRNWPNLETYRDKITQTTQILNEYPFDIEDCGVFVAGYAEYLSEEINVPSDGFEAEYHQMRYVTLVRKYDIQKEKKGYVSENDDPPRPKSRIIQISDENRIFCIE